MTDQALLVPVRVTALMVNPSVRASAPDNMLRWRLNYAQPFYQGPEPYPGDAPLTERDDPKDGVILHWELPRALRDTDPLRRGSTAPLRVPDRWVVVRYVERSGGEREARAWLVQSDCLRERPADFGDNSPFGEITDPTTDPKVAKWRIGRVWDLDADITEPEKWTPLTAFGPGVPTFSVYQPYNNGVFSMHDALVGLEADDDPLDLSYQVFGWYHDPKADPLAAAIEGPSDRYEERLRALLENLRWRLPGKVPGTLRSVHVGSVHGLVWKKDGQGDGDEKPQRDPQTRRWKNLHLGMGEGSGEGLCALAKEIPDIWPSDPKKKAEYQARLQALQYGLLNKYDSPDGRAEVAQKAHETRFDPVPGGFTWDFVSEPSPQGEPAPAPEIPAAQKTWLRKLEADQKGYDEARREVTRLQHRLRDLWGYHQHAQYLGSKSDPYSSAPKKMRELAKSIEPEFDRSGDSSLAKRIKTRLEELAGARAIVRETDAVKLKEAIADELAKLKEELGHDPVGVLTRFPRPAFQNAAEPVALLRGVGARRLLRDEPGELTCRYGTQTIVEVDGTAPTDVVPAGFDKVVERPGWKDVLPTTLHTALLTEFTALDDHRKPSDTTRVGFADEVTLDWGADDPRLWALRVQTEWWTQPWTPLYLIWTADYYPIAYEDQRPGHQGERNWRFDGNLYQWHGEGHVAQEGELPPLHYAWGRILLSPHAVHNLADRYRHLSEATKGQDPDFLKFIAGILANFQDASMGTDLISQALDGFNEQLTGRESVLRPAPGRLDDLLDPDYAYSTRRFQTGPKPSQGENDPENWIRPISAEGLRAGQFFLSRMQIVDRFGRCCVVDKEDGVGRPDLKVGLSRSAMTTPDDKVPNSGKADATVLAGWQNVDWSKRVVHLRPRLPQPARVNFEALSRGSETEPPVRPTDGEQIRAWIVPNHLDGGLLCYDPDGALLGELRALGEAVVWEDAGSGLTPDPELSAFITGLTDKGTAGLTAFLKAVELGRLTISPDRPSAGHPALRMLGRPMALVRARLGLEPDAGAIVPIKLARLTATDPRPAYMDYTWPVLLGSNAAFHDGLVGYFKEADYGTFYAVTPPEEKGGYVADRKNGEDLRLSLKRGEFTKVSLLMDPWTDTHATTHILPAARLRLEPEAVAVALARMEALFHIGPNLGSRRPITARKGESVQAETKAFPLPLPKVEHGTWAWVKTADRKDPVPVCDDDGAARLTPETPTHLRTGLLYLKHGFRAETAETDAPESTETTNNHREGTA
ncbi:hypothetical protein ACIQFP_14905 [Nocardiopsis alba]|uniref:hypothetical protein n=1 Tax=Nocardiopsis alba TaxID=53437 RepID=UPI003823F97F